MEHMGKAVKGVVMKTSHLGAIEMIAEGGQPGRQAHSSERPGQQHAGAVGRDVREGSKEDAGVGHGQHRHAGCSDYEVTGTVIQGEGRG